MEDLEIGEPVNPPEIAVKSTTTTTWYDRFGQPQPRRRELWFNFCCASAMIPILFTYSLFLRLEESLLCIVLLYSLLYIWLITYVTFARDPLPYVLRRREKQLFESAYVVVSSCWTYYYRDGDILTAMLGLALFFNVIPLSNLWWNFENISFEDCYLIVWIDAALLCCRYLGGGGVLVLVAGVGVALQLMKDAYRRHCSQKIKHSEIKLFV